MNPIVLHVPGWAAPWLIFITSVISLLTVIANATSHISDDRIAEVRAVSPRLAALLVLSRHWGIIVRGPAWAAAWTVIRGAVKLVPAAMVLLMLSCTPTMRQQAINVGNAAADVSTAETHRLLSIYCEQEMHVLGHPASLGDNGHCTRSDLATVPPASASPDQAAALATLRARWRHVLDTHEALVRAQNGLASLLNSGVAASDGDLLTAVAQLATAYQEFRAAGAEVGVTLPTLLGGQ